MSDDERLIRPGPQRIAPLTSAAAPASVPTMEGYSRLLGMLRDIRAEVQNLRRVLEEIKDKDDLEDDALRAQEIITILRRNQSIYANNTTKIEARLDELRGLMHEVPILYDRYGDEITHIENQWERATNDWPHLPDLLPEAPAASESDDHTEEEDAASAQGETPAADEREHDAANTAVRRARRAIKAIDQLIYHAGLLTIPARLNQHMEQLRIGQRLDFHATFSDEVPDDDDRQRILEFLGSRPMAVHNGIVDVAKGVVLHASPSPGRRRLSYMLILAAILLGAALTWLVAELGTLFDLADWPVEPGSAMNLLVGYGFVIAGGVVHIGVDAIKQARASQGQSFLALEDWFLWIHIHEIGIIIGVVSLWMGFFGLLFLMGSVEWQTAFLVGYSIDSFIDMFLQRFNTGASTKAAAIRL